MADGTLLGLCGALRAGSYNRRLMHEAAKRFSPATFAEGDLRLPLYDGDLEEAEGVPGSVKALADSIAAADAVIISSPEYNKSLSGVLKNALDWISRVDHKPFLNKPVAIMSATAGRTGGEVAQNALRLALVSFGPRLLLGPHVLVASAPDQFDGATLTNAVNAKALNQLMANLREAAGLQALPTEAAA
ncbi:MAG: NAD(P)H-dependent oxidoreductase [Pseudomonadota bacterium]